MYVLLPAVYASIALAISSASLGVVISRFFWAEDLKNAQSIDAIRSQTEIELRRQIESLDRLVETLRR